MIQPFLPLAAPLLFALVALLASLAPGRRPTWLLRAPRPRRRFASITTGASVIDEVQSSSIRGSRSDAMAVS